MDIKTFMERMELSNMNIQNLRYLLAVAKTLNMTQAADSLYISQQGLSNQISRLERELNTQLFERTPYLKLTQSGEYAVRTAAHILEQYDQLVTQIDRLKGLQKGVLRLGVFAKTRASIFMPQILPPYHELYPNVELHVEVDKAAVLLDKLRVGSLDLVLSNSNTAFESPASEFSSINVVKEMFCIVISDQLLRRSFPDISEETILRFSTDGISVQQVISLPFLQLSKDHLVRRISDQVFSSTDLVPNVILECNEMGLLLTLCAQGMGMVCAYEMTAQNLSLITAREAQMHYFPIKEATDLFINTTIYYRKGVKLSESSVNFLRLFLQVINPTQATFLSKSRQKLVEA